MLYTISILVENEFGVLARVAGLFSGRGFNIESLSVAETMDPSVSRITLVTRGDDQVLEQRQSLAAEQPVDQVADRFANHLGGADAGAIDAGLAVAARLDEPAPA